MMAFLFVNIIRWRDAGDQFRVGNGGKVGDISEK